MPLRVALDVKLQSDGTYIGRNFEVGLLVVAGTLSDLDAASS